MLETLQNSVGLISKLTDRVDKMADRLERVCRRCTRTFLSTPSLVLFLTLISYKLEQIGRDKLLHVNKGKKASRNHSILVELPPPKKRKINVKETPRVCANSPRVFKSAPQQCLQHQHKVKLDAESVELLSLVRERKEEDRIESSEEETQNVDEFDLWKDNRVPGSW
eukprot:TRINITY_DN6039_c0_g1_i3.p2 TRINITY_DN6039_c0_g1~~TRINITY_DN6039_c0_g1_i3.p2  ORF type:complete len:167 (-),score=45.84 TRINITY_DN6039_c0_g1_i3:171-671(-)